LTQEKVVERLTCLLHAEIEVTIEIQATRRAGFSDDVVCTVGGNVRTLHLLPYGFAER
jgi:hypothetical protein